MASASLATLRISSALALFDMRNVGLSFASAALAGSSDGKTLSVTAITGPAIANSKLRRTERGGTYASGICPSTGGNGLVGGHFKAAGTSFPQGCPLD